MVISNVIIKSNKAIEYKNKNTISIILIIGIMFILFLGISSFLFSVNLDTFILIFSLLIILLLGKSNPNFFIKYICVLFMHCSNLIGVYITENNRIFLTELRVYSHRHNSFFLITMAHLIFFVSLFYFDQVYEQNASPKKRIKILFNDRPLNIFLIQVIVVALFSFLLLGFIHVFSNPAFKYSFDRFLYNQLFLQGVWGKVRTAVVWLFPIVCILFLKRRKKLCLCLLLLYLIYSFWTGNKFGFMLEVLFLAMPVLLTLVKKYGINVVKIAVYGVLVFVLMIGVVIAHNYFTEGMSLEKNYEYLLQRTAQQGQVWWGIYDVGGDYHINELKDEFSVYFTFNNVEKSKYNYGIYKMMRMITPASFFYNKVLTGSRFSCSTYASVYYYFNSWGVLAFSLISSWIYSLIINKYKSNVNNGYIIESVIYGNFGLVMNSVITQSDFDVAFSYRTFALLMVLFVVTIMRHLNDDLLDN